MRKIEKRNYMKAILLFIVTIMIVLFLTNYFIKKNDYEKNSNNRMNNLTYLSEDSIDDYIVENHDAIIYISDSSNDALEQFEIDLVKLFVDKDLEGTIVYIDSSKLSDGYMLDNFGSEIVPNIIIYKEGIISNVMNIDVLNIEPVEIINYIEINWEL